MKRFAYSPKCAQNYDRYIASSRRSAGVDYLPIKLDIENVSRCNFRCTMCQVSDWHKGKRAEDLPLAEFKRIIDEQEGLIEIKLQGLGEPTMQREPYFEMIRYARERRIWVRTTTNASLLHIDGAWYRLIDAGTNEIQISIDGATKTAFEAIRIGADFWRVTANCKLINDHSRSRGIERTKMWTVVQRGNVHQLEALVDLAAELGFTNQVFSLDVSDWGSAEWHKRNAALDVESELDEDRLLALVEQGRALGVRVAFWVVTEKYDADNICAWPFERAFVSSDLRVSPCCVISNPDTMQIGPNMTRERSFKDIWLGEDYREFRSAHMEGRIPPACQGCYKSIR
jgi:MoaA/NifB/PqqE/SkfB family radical SAM enzyme